MGHRHVELRFSLARLDQKLTALLTTLKYDMYKRRLYQLYHPSEALSIPLGCRWKYLRVPWLLASSASICIEI